MSLLALNLLLALIWVFLSGSFGLGGLLAGFAAGFLSIAGLRPFLHSGRYVRGAIGLVRLVVAYSGMLVGANLHVARDVLRRELPFRPGIVRVDARDLGPLETVVFASLLSLAPGSLALDTDARGHHLFVLTLYAGDPDAARRDARRYAGLVRAAGGARRRRL